MNNDEQNTRNELSRVRNLSFVNPQILDKH